MDPDVALERLLWLEAQGTIIAHDARQLSRQVRRARLVDQDDLQREIAKLAIVTRARGDEVAIWREHLAPSAEPPAPRPVPMPAPLRRRWWPW